MWRPSFVARRPTFRTFSQAKYPAYRSSRTLPLVAGNLFAASGSISGWKPTNHNGRIRGMPEFIADGAQERRNEMRRKRFQRGSLKPRKRKGKTYWYAQWREYGEPRS